ncbi:MAG: hypothetical protein AAGI17_10080 [Planctomycetota bacterium]
MATLHIYMDEESEGRVPPSRYKGDWHPGYPSGIDVFQMLSVRAGLAVVPAPADEGEPPDRHFTICPSDPDIYERTGSSYTYVAGNMVGPLFDSSEVYRAFEDGIISLPMFMDRIWTPEAPTPQGPTGRYFHIQTPPESKAGNAVFWDGHVDWY